MSQNKVKPNVGGRPALASAPKASKGKGRLLSANISQELRAALEEEAARTDRSISQVAERWMEEARKGRAQYNQLMGGNAGMAAAVEKLVEIAKVIQEALPEPDMNYWAIAAAWELAAKSVLPAPPPTPDVAKRYMTYRDAWNACGKVLQALHRAGTMDKVYQRALKPLDGPGGLLGTTTVASQLASVLALDTQSPSGLNAPHDLAILGLEALRATGKTARAEIDSALELMRAVAQSESEAQAKISFATTFGQTVAFTSTSKPVVAPALLKTAA